MDKAFIFDRSGTLNDNFHSFCQVVDNIFTEFDKKQISHDEIRKTFTLPYMKFRNFHIPQITKEKQDELYQKYIHAATPADIYRGVSEMLHTLHANWWKLFVVSSDNLSTLLPEIQKGWLSSLFSKVIGEVHEKWETLSTLVQEFNLDKDTTFYVGDTSWDIEAGKFAWVKTIGISWWFQHKDMLSKSEPDFLIDTIEEIENIM